MELSLSKALQTDQAAALCKQVLHPRTLRPRLQQEPRLTPRHRQKVRAKVANRIQGHHDLTQASMLQEMWMYTAAQDQAGANLRRIQGMIAIHSTRTEMIEADLDHIKAAHQAIHSAMKVAATIEILVPIGTTGTKTAEIENYLEN